MVLQYLSPADSRLANTPRANEKKRLWSVVIDCSGGDGLVPCLKHLVTAGEEKGGVPRNRAGTGWGEE